MKPITNILLIIALICYIFLPFQAIEPSGAMSGWQFTASLITRNFSIVNTLFALVPFIACFGAIGFNCMKHRYWGLIAGLFILGGICFYMWANTPLQMPLPDDPEVVADVPQEGAPVKGVAAGYYVSYALMWLSLVSCIISLMPFKFNTVLEKQIDDSWERGLSRSRQELNKVGKEINQEFSHLESRTRKAKAKPQMPQPGTQPSIPAAEPSRGYAPDPDAQPTQPRRQENPADYMPPGSQPIDDKPAATPPPFKADDNDDDNPDAAYMPKGDYQP